MAQYRGQSGPHRVHISWVRLLLLVPFAAMLWVPSYNAADPAWLGIPLFYWYQLLWIPLSSVLLGIVYWVEN